MPAEAVSTVIDRLVELVNARGPISVKDAAKALAMTEVQIEDMANVLAESGMLRVRYTLTGIFLEPKRMPIEGLERGGKAEGKAQPISARMKFLEKALTDSLRSFQVVSKEMSKHIQKYSAELAQIEGSADGASCEELDGILRDAFSIEKVSEHFISDLEAAVEELNGLREKVRSLKTKAAKLRAQKQLEKKERRKGLLGRLFSMLPIKRSD